MQQTQLDYLKVKKVHIIGIEGGGTSALALFYKEMGLEVSGSDEGDHFFQDILLAKQIKLFSQFSPDNIPADVDFIVYSSAWKAETNPELQTALNLQKPMLSYAQALADLFNQKQGIAVAGTHGKTTTSAWLSFLLSQTKINPSYIIGGKIPQLANRSSSWQNSDYFIIEADEYQNKLQYYNPQIVLLNNVDYDHPDYFPSKEEYQKVFLEFIKKISASGKLIANFDDEFIAQNAKLNCPGKIISYGIKNKQVNYVAKNIQQDQEKQTFTLFQDGQEKGNFQINLFGEHNVLNALAVIATAQSLDINFQTIQQYLAEFKGVARRLEYLGQWQEVPIIDDFAHHPTEIKASLQAIKQKYPDKNIITVFYPHTFSRTKTFFNDFINSFDQADEVIILDIYSSAREKQGEINSQELVEKMNMLYPEKQIQYLADFQQVGDYLKKHLQKNDLLLLLGAGDVFQIGKKLLQVEK